MTTGSALVFPPTVSRGQYIRDLFKVERTQFLLMRRKKRASREDAEKILDALVEWDTTIKDGADTHQLSVQYNALLDGAL